MNAGRSFETAAARPPQDDGLLVMPPKKYVMVRSAIGAAEARLEPRMLRMQPVMSQ
jgi:hypothetical protein